MATEVRDLVLAVLRDGDEHGVRFIKGPHVPPHRIAQLADLTHRHAWEHGTDESDVPGWRRYPGGILTWWAEEADLDDEGKRRLHKFRSDVVGVLEGRNSCRARPPGSRAHRTCPPPDQ